MFHPSYNTLISVGIGLSLLLLYYSYRGRYAGGGLADTLLAGLVGGVLLARAGHIGLHWAYFGDNLAEIWQLSGLNWHGAVIGGLLGMGMVARWRGVRFSGLLPGLALTLPLLAFMAWWGCMGAQCSYGAAVDNLSEHPAWLVWEARDIDNRIEPRYATQHTGMMAAAVLLVGVAISMVRGRAVAFWAVLAAWCAVMFGLGFLRGDEVQQVAGLRLDQYFDLALLLLACGVGWFHRGRSPAVPPDA